MTGPLVSVIMIVRNGERFLESAIRSVIEQDYRPLEIIVVDGKSTDRTPEIAAGFPEVRLVQQAGTGIPDAYNTGIDAAKGNLIAFLSHDDLWLPGKLTTQVDFLVNNPEIQYCIAHVTFFLEQGHQPPPGFKRELLEGDHVGYIMETLVARKTVFDIVGRFDTRRRVSEDTDWYARAKDARVPMAVIPCVFLRKRIHDANSAGDVDVVSHELMEVIKGSLRRKKSTGKTEQGPGAVDRGSGPAGQNTPST